MSLIVTRGYGYEAMDGSLVGDIIGVNLDVISTIEVNANIDTVNVNLDIDTDDVEVEII